MGATFDAASVTVILRLGSAAVMMVGATIHDLRSRQVPNRYWIPFLVLAGLATAFDLAYGAWTPAALAAASTLAFWALWRLGAYGGADAKALIILAWLAPRPAATHAATLAVDAASWAILIAAAVGVFALLTGKTGWVQRGRLPFLAYLTAGGCVAYLAGNPMLRAFRLFPYPT